MTDTQSMTIFTCYDGPAEGEQLVLPTERVKTGDLVRIAARPYERGPDFVWAKPTYAYRADTDTRRLTFLFEISHDGL